MFIFPQNYNFKNKFLGYIDYSTIIFNIIWVTFIFFLLHFFHLSFSLKASILIIFCFPVFIISIIGLNHENILYVCFYIFKFLINKNIFLYKKDPY